MPLAFPPGLCFWPSPNCLFRSVLFVFPMTCGWMAGGPRPGCQRACPRGGGDFGGAVLGVCPAVPTASPGSSVGCWSSAATPDVGPAHGRAGTAGLCGTEHVPPLEILCRDTGRGTEPPPIGRNPWGHFPGWLPLPRQSKVGLRPAHGPLAVWLLTGWGLRQLRSELQNQT